jgi:hypothetical protein
VIVSSMFGMHLLQVFGILLFMNDEFNWIENLKRQLNYCIFFKKFRPISSNWNKNYSNEWNSFTKSLNWKIHSQSIMRKNRNKPDHLEVCVIQIDQYLYALIWGLLLLLLLLLLNFNLWSTFGLRHTTFLHFIYTDCVNSGLL